MVIFAIEDTKIKRGKKRWWQSYITSTVVTVVFVVVGRDDGSNGAIQVTRRITRKTQHAAANVIWHYRHFFFSDDVT